MGWLSYQYQQYRQKFKPHVVGLILDFLDEDPNIGLLHYDARRAIDEHTFRGSRLFVAARACATPCRRSSTACSAMPSLRFPLRASFVCCPAIRSSS